MERSKTRLAPDESACESGAPMLAGDSNAQSPKAAQGSELSSPRFNVLHVLSIGGPLDVDVLERRLLELRRNHASLQGGLDRVGNRLEERNRSEEPEPVRFLDLEGLHSTAQKFSYTSTLRELLQTKLDPRVGQLLQILLVRWSKESHSLVFLAHAWVADARLLRLLSEELVAMYHGSTAVPFASSTQRNGSESGSGETRTPKAITYQLTGQTEVKGSISPSWRVADQRGQDGLLAMATAAFISHNERSPLPKPLHVRARLAELENDGFNQLVRSILSKEGFQAQTKLPNLAVLQADVGASLIAARGLETGVKAATLQVALQEVVPGFSQSVGWLRFTSEEIRDPLCNSDLSVHIDDQGSAVRIYLNFDTDLLDETTMRFWLEGYERAFGRIAENGIVEIGANENGNRWSLLREREPAPHVREAAISTTENEDMRQTPPDVSNVLGDTFVGPSTQAERKLARIWAEVLKLENIGVNENFFDLGGHSLLAVKLFSQITNEFGVELSLNTLLEHGTIRELARLLETPQTVDDPECRLISLQANVVADRLPLFWIPGGRAISVLAFREVSASLGLDQPVYGLESRLPGPGEPLLSVPMRATRYISLVRSIQPKGPYYLAGFCMGGMVAFEMAQQLINQGETVGLLALVQASMPGFPASRFQRFRLNSQHQWFLCKTLLKFLATRYASKIVGIHRETKQRVLNEVSKLILGWHGTSAQLPDETQAANTQTMYAYRPQPYPGNIDIILAEDCYESSGISESLDPRRAWARITRGKCATHVLPGDHHSILVNGNASRLAKKMRTLLDEAARDLQSA